MSSNQTVRLNDGERDIEMRIVASFGLDEANYALLETPEGDVLLFSVTTEGDEALFMPVEDEKEWDEAMEAYEELLDENSRED